MHRPAAFAAIVLGVLLPHPSLRAADGVVEVKLAAAIQRTWDQVKADGYAYGPKQTYDAKTHETHVYLPYGKDKRWYRDVRGTLYDATATGPAKFHQGIKPSFATTSNKTSKASGFIWMVS